MLPPVEAEGMVHHKPISRDVCNTNIKQMKIKEANQLAFDFPLYIYHPPK